MLAPPLDFLFLYRRKIATKATNNVQRNVYEIRNNEANFV